MAKKLGAGIQIYFTTKKCKLCYSDLWVLLEGFSWVSSAKNQRSKDNNFYVICHAFLRTVQCASFVHAELTTGSLRIPNSASIGQNCLDFISNTLYIRYITNIVVLHAFLLKRMYKNTYTMVCHTAKTKCRKFETNISRKGISGPQSQFPHSCVCERIIYSHDGSACSAGGNM
jgi:hypothetical protein